MKNVIKDYELYEYFGRIVLTHHDIDDEVRNIGKSVSNLGDQIRSNIENVNVVSIAKQMNIELTLLSHDVDQYKMLITELLSLSTESEDGEKI